MKFWIQNDVYDIALDIYKFFKKNTSLPEANSSFLLPTT